MNIRELVTKFVFNTDEAGLKDYEKKVQSTLSSVKSSVMRVGSFFGVELAAQFGMSLMHSAKAASKQATQLGQILREGTDVQEVTNEIFRIAQATGEEYVKVGERFKDMAISGRELGVSQETALAATENISKALDVGRQSGEEQAAAFNQINMALKRGVFTQRQFGELLQGAPILIRTLGQALGKTEAQLREMAKTNQFSSKMLIEALAKTNKQLNKEAAETPLTLGNAFNYARNEVVRVVAAMNKANIAIKYVAQGIVWLTNTIVTFGKGFVDAVGGGTHAMELLQIAILAVAGPALFKFLVAATMATAKWAIATIAATWPWIALAAALLAVYLIFEDISFWMQGKSSAIGDFLGPFKEWEATLKPILDPLKAIKNFFTGSWNMEALEKLKEEFPALATTISELEMIFGGLKTAWETVNTVGVALWNTLKNIIATDIKPAFQALNEGGFSGLIRHLGEVTGQTELAETAATHVDEAYTAWGADGFAGLIRYLGVVIGQTELVEGVATFVEDTYAAWNEGGFPGLIRHIGEVIGQTELAETAASFVENAYVAWNEGGFSGLMAHLGQVTGMTEVIKTTATNIKASYDAWNEGGFAGLISHLGQITGVTEQIEDAIDWVGDAIDWVAEQFAKLNALTFADIINYLDQITGITDAIKTAVDWVLAQFAKLDALTFGALSGVLNALKATIDAIAGGLNALGLVNEQGKLQATSKDAQAVQDYYKNRNKPQTEAGIAEKPPGWLERNLTFKGIFGGSAAPNTPPGAVTTGPSASAAPAQMNLSPSNTVNVTNVIDLDAFQVRLMAQIDEMITRSNGRLTQDMARAIIMANPGAEAA